MIFSTCRIAASPVRFGTGIKTKNLLALAHGVPLVTTTVGADGLNLSDGSTALIADSPPEFSQTASSEPMATKICGMNCHAKAAGSSLTISARTRMREAVCCVD